MTEVMAGAGAATLTAGWKLDVEDHRATGQKGPGSPWHQPRRLKLRLLHEGGGEEKQPCLLLNPVLFWHLSQQPKCILISTDDLDGEVSQLFAE